MRPRWVVSAAYGIFYEPYYTGQAGPLQAPVSPAPYLQTPQLNFPNFSDPYHGQNPFNGTIAQPMTLLAVDKNLRLPYAQDWNLNIEKAFGANWLAEIGYVGGPRERSCRGLSKEIPRCMCRDSRRKTM